MWVEFPQGRELLMEDLELEGLDLFQSLVVLAERLVELTGENK
jgi:hypothetical protein